jgi:predicted DNA-binding protein YlxM (UPF0122 family)
MKITDWRTNKSKLKRALTRREQRMLDEEGNVSYYISNDDKIADVARSLGITRQAASQTLKRAMEKVYYCVEEMEPELTPFQIAVHISHLLTPNAEVRELKNLINQFPNKIRMLIESDASKLMPGVTIGRNTINE